MIRLSCFNILDKIDVTTPQVVLKEISRIYRVDIDLSDMDRTLFKLKEADKDQPSVIIPLNVTEQGHVAHFINPYVTWPSDKLEEALYNLEYQMTSEAIPRSTFTYGYSTPEDTAKYNMFYLYKICKQFHLPLNSSHGIDDMATAVKMIAQDGSISRSYIYRRLSLIDSKFLPSIYLSMTDKDTGTEIDYDDQIEDCSEYSYYRDITDAVAEFTTKRSLLLRTTPINDGESITLAALNFNIDITESLNMVAEYTNLILCHQLCKKWIPIDENMRIMREKNPFEFDLSTNFNPRIPDTLYCDDNLESMALREGYTSDQIQRDGAYCLLCTSFLSPTFYHGIPSYIDAETEECTSIEWEPIDEIDPDHALAYGIKPTGKYIIFKYTEICTLFRTRKCFVNPVTNEVFPSLAISKLKAICQSIHPGQTVDGSRQRKQVLREIDLVELFLDEEKSKIREFYEASLDLEIMNSFHNLLKGLFHIAMCCRGWLKNIDPLPIESAPVENQYLVDIRVTTAFNDFDSIICKTDPDINRMFLQLPLLKFRQGGWKTVDTPVDGNTIGGRLTILRKGEDHEDQHSCMRLTSNYLASSVYRYMYLVKLDPPFEIEKLREIS